VKVPPRQVGPLGAKPKSPAPQGVILLSNWLRAPTAPLARRVRDVEQQIQQQKIAWNLINEEFERRRDLVCEQWRAARNAALLSQERL
jgi:hypothetical protein